ncbi:AMP-binding protein [Streptomyces sp. NPDC057445]|uniref:AMP-binding protein n=1 Tax=Streptomyces sp. NPDC057445 TaxID=3346136 RepID=UPI003688758F
MSGGQLHQLFEERVQEAPDRAAVVTEDSRTSYGELDERAERLARHLLEVTRPPAGAVMAVCATRVADVLVGVLGALKAGGAFTVVPQNGTVGDIRQMLDVSGARVVIAESALLPRVDPGEDQTVVRLDMLRDATAAHSAIPSGTTPGANAAVLFTAGTTTGERRPVPASHARLTAAYRAWDEVYRLTGGDALLVTAVPGTTEFTGGWIRALCSGATLVAARGPVGGEPVTVADVDPVTAAALPADELPSLRLMAVGGERLTLAEQLRLEERLAPGARVIHVYGPTEAAGCGTWFETDQLPGPVERPEGSSYLGTPFPGCAVELRKDRIRLTPPDGGDAVDTGDLGRREGERPLEFRGRSAARVTVDGRTVDTYRVESALAGHPAVREAVVGESGGELTAYVVPESAGAGGQGDDAGAPTAAGLRTHLRGAVPAADIPRSVVSIPSLPRNEAGKVDRRALPGRPQPASARRSGGKFGSAVGGGAAHDPGRGRMFAPVRWCLLPLVVFALAVTLTDELWPGSTDLSLVPESWATLFRGLYLAEWLAFTVGVTFLVNGRPAMRRQGKPLGLTVAAHLALVWLLVSWWPQDNFYRLASKDDWPRQAALVYAFNVPLMIAAGVVVAWAVARRADDR